MGSKGEGSELERASQRDKEEWHRLIEKRETEQTHLKENNQVCIMWMLPLKGDF